MIKDPTIEALTRQIKKQVIFCGLLTPVFLFLILGALQTFFGSSNQFGHYINGALSLFTIIQLIKLTNRKSNKLDSSDKKAEMTKLLKILVYSKYFMIFGISISVLTVAAGKSNKSIGSKECLGSALTKPIEIRFQAHNPIEFITLVVDGAPLQFREDIVIRNKDIFKVEDKTNEFNATSLKFILNEEGQKKLTKGSSDSVGKLMVILVGGTIASSPVIGEAIPTGEILVSLSKNSDEYGSVLFLTSKDLCSQ